MKYDPLVGDLVIRTNPRGPGIVIVKLPGGDRSIVPDAAGHIDDARRSKVRPGKLFFAGPHDFHRTLGCSRESSRFNRCLSRVLAAVSRIAVWHQDAHFIFGYVKCFRELPANAKRTLRAGPDGQLITFPLSHRS